MRIDEGAAQVHIEPASSSVSGLRCSNLNRAITSTCAITQSYEKSQTSTFSMSEEFTSSSEFNWGSESSIATGSESSVETTNEFSFGFEEHFNIHAEMEASVKIFGMGVTMSGGVGLDLGANQQWMESETVGS